MLFKPAQMKKFNDLFLTKFNDFFLLVKALRVTLYDAFRVSERQVVLFMIDRQIDRPGRPTDKYPLSEIHSQLTKVRLRLRGCYFESKIDRFTKKFTCLRKLLRYDQVRYDQVRFDSGSLGKMKLRNPRLATNANKVRLPASYFEAFET